MTTVNITPKTQIIFAFIILAVLWFFNINQVHLLKPDEGRYAEIAREMATTGDFVTPRINGVKYFEKPPLQYWTTAIAFKLFGESEGTARLWTALTGFLTLLSVFFFTRRYYNLQTATLAVCVLISSLLFVALGRISVLDMGLSFFLTLTALSLSILLTPHLSRREYNIANFIFWTAVALGFLSKGLVAIFLPGLAGLIHILLRREWRTFLRVRWVSGSLLFLAISAPWIWLVAKRNPEFMHFFFIHEHLERYLTTSHQREGPIYYFIPFLIAGLFPWIYFLPRLRKLDSKALFFLIWSVSIFVFFSLSSSKIITYILPIFPTLAILIAMALVKFPKPKDVKIVGGSLFVFGLLIFFGSFYVATLDSKRIPNIAYMGFSKYLQVAGAFLAVSIGSVLYLPLQRINKFVTMSVLSLASFQTIYLGYNCFTPNLSSYVGAQVILPYVKDDVPVYSYNYYEQEMPFYLKHFIHVVNYNGELEFGLENEKPPHFMMLPEFLEAWAATPRLVLIIEPRNLFVLEENNLKYKILHQDKTRLIVYKGEN
jgi:4-amino-4-deoxy-L-arabinose transferase-like glycosyltransferase